MSDERSRTSVLGGAIISFLVVAPISAAVVGGLAVLGIRQDEYQDVLPASAVFFWGAFVSLIWAGPGAFIWGAVEAKLVRSDLLRGLPSPTVLRRSTILSAGAGAIYGATLGVFNPVGISSSYLGAVGLFVGSVCGFVVAKSTISDFKSNSS